MKIRTTIPKNNKYYIRTVSGGLNQAVAGSPTISGANVLANCVGYANGRFNEIINDPDLKGIVKSFKYQLVCNAENFIESAKRQGLKISSKPTVGGIMVWQKGATLGGGDGAGHVAIVEQIYSDGSIYTSESGWGSREWAFKNIRRNNSNGRWGQASAYKFRGCIINPTIGGGTPIPTPKLTVDGIGGVNTVMRMQEYFKMSVIDGVISGQNSALKKYYPSLKSVSFGKGGSATVKALQKWVGVTQDGILGYDTCKAWQKKVKALGYNVGTVDGIFGTQSMKAYQECLNNDCKKKDSPTPTPTKDIKVVDVSAYQDSINWTKAKADGVKGAIIRCGYRGYETGKLQTDSMFLNHIKGANKAGVPVGIYFFTEAKTEKEGREEADYAIKLWQTAGVPLSFPIAVDSEAAGGNKDRCKNLTKAQRTNAIKGFCEQIKAKGYKPMIYASTSWLNNKLDMSKLPYDVWVAQYASKCEYKGKYIMWQYSSSGKVNGIKGNVDLNHCYIEPKPYNPTPTPKPTPTGYTGTFPSYRLTKTNAKVIADACKWAKWIADGIDFHYGCNDHAFHNGCYFCGTNDKFKKGHGIKMWETTYCCNPFVGAAWAHGGGDATAYKMCHNCNSWGFAKNEGYEKSSLFDKLGKPAKSKLKAGDVLCNHTHVALYVGDGKIAEASGLDDNVYGSTKWKNSIAVKTLTDAKYKTFERCYRYNGKVNADRPLSNGEVSDRVADMQKFLIWYGKKLTADGIFGHLTLTAVKEFQKEQKLVVDGIVGEKTIEAMKKVEK